MRRREPKAFSLNREARVTKRRSGPAFQTDERFWQALISPDAHHFHLSYEIAIREE